MVLLFAPLTPHRWMPRMSANRQMSPALRDSSLRACSLLLAPCPMHLAPFVRPLHAPRPMPSRVAGLSRFAPGMLLAPCPVLHA
jgi:hypothetical protein